MYIYTHAHIQAHTHTHIQTDTPKYRVRSGTALGRGFDPRLEHVRPCNSVVRVRVLCDDYFGVDGTAPPYPSKLLLAVSDMR